MDHRKTNIIKKFFDLFYRRLKDPLHLEEKITYKDPKVSQETFSLLFPNFPYKFIQVIKGEVPDSELIKFLIIYGKADYYYNNFNSAFFYNVA